LWGFGVVYGGQYTTEAYKGVFIFENGNYFFE